MDTEILRDNMAQAAAWIRAGELVAVPTETVYGLAANGLNADAVYRIYEVKDRPENKALALMVPDPQAIDRYCRDVPEAARALAEAFWPGPLTLILSASEAVPEIVRAGGSTVGLRCPDHPLTLEALRLADLPFAAPSANPSGEPSPKTAQQVYRYFAGRIRGIVDGGPCGIGLESTILDMSATPYRILRQGGLPEAEIREELARQVSCIGITGGTGCGKTTALRELEKQGALVLDCDAIYHQLLEGSEDMRKELEARFPGVVQEGKIQRKALGAIVFADEQALEDLNRITHAYVGRAVEARLEDWAMQGGRLAAIDAIELISSGLARRCLATVGILAREEIRAERIMRRDCISKDYAILRIQAQKPDSYFIDNCDYVVENNETEEAFSQRFNTILKEILKHG